MPPISKWFQDYFNGLLRTPQAIYQAAIAELNGPADGARFFGAPPDDGIVWDAPQRLRAPAHFKSKTWLVQSQRANWAGCDPRIAVWSARFIQAAQRRGIPLYVHTAFRGQDEQQRLLASGRSRASFGRSAHNIGEAVDIVHGTLHWDMNKSEWLLLHTLARRVLDRCNAGAPKDRRLVLNWGGEFKGLYDPAHWEIADFRSRLGPRPDFAPLHMMPKVILDRWKGALAF